MKEGGNFLKRNNGGVRSGCESFLNGCYQRAGLTPEGEGESRGSGIKRREIKKDARIRKETRGEGKDVTER